MDEIDSRLLRMDRGIVESARRQLPDIAKKGCPNCPEGTCERAGGPCAFPTRPPMLSALKKQPFVRQGVDRWKTLLG